MTAAEGDALLRAKSHARTLPEPGAGEPFPLAVCWVVNLGLAAGLWALIVVPFLR